MPAPRSLGYARLVDACARPGCPVCRCVRDDALRRLAALLYEHVTDPASRAALRAARGFCAEHAAMLASVPDSALGAAIIAADLLAAEVGRAEAALAALAEPTGGRLRRILRRDERGARGGRARPPCPACEAAREAEARHLDTMRESAGEARLDQAFDLSDGLCLPHAERLVERGAGDPAAARLLARAVAKWRRLVADLRRFADKHDHANREPFTEAEARAGRLAWDLLTGTPAPRGDARPARDHRA